MFIVLALFMILASVHEGLFQVQAVSLLWCFVGTNFKNLTGWVRASLEFEHVVLGLSKLAVEIIKFYCYFLQRHQFSGHERDYVFIDNWFQLFVYTK